MPKRAPHPAVLHPIQVVTHRTGVSADVLRVWEKRYAVDQETLREYFPTLPTVHWMLEEIGEVVGHGAK